MLLFVGTTAFAMNERFKRDVAEIAYTKDFRGLQFLLQKESEVLQQMSDTVEASSWGDSPTARIKQTRPRPKSSAPTMLAW